MKTLTLFMLIALGTATATPAADIQAGKAVYDQICVTCHMAKGEGLPGAFPPLAQSDYFKKATDKQLVHIVSQGITGEVVVNGTTFNSVMPPQTLTDQETADVLNYVSVQFNAGKPRLTAARVQALRAGK
ncbi:nitrite reductase (NO-forming) [Silvimonas terrae]|uniref:Nitrite reductase (NO-forming) n=1 Tax=Silvimonas terrae TaxID=300266 RepID=A0A840RHG0_9NEIS|nr:cytochrome c [Silvimonas terrae]MBB5192765.1 nitrite reductase (NO-forming) [Silvimonas terrae]